MIFGAKRSRYSINILATSGGISNASSIPFFTSLGWQLQRRDRARAFTHEQMRVKFKRREILQPQRHVAQDCDRECRLRFGERAEVRLAVPPRFCPEPLRQRIQAAQNGGVIELPQGPLVLVRQPHDRRRHFADEAFELGEDLSVNLHPLMRNLNERFAELEIEGVFCAADAIEAPTQDALEVIGRDQIGERPDGGRPYPGFHQGRDGGMDLIAAQPQRPRRQGAWPRIGRKRIGDAAPGQMGVHVLPKVIGEERPIDPLGRAIGRHRHRPQAERGIARRFIPDLRHLPVQHRRSRAKGLLTNRRDEARQSPRR